ncbi:hypothetical protein Dsin_018696 [Dipteronia sinensis]|uniref:Uncharacterized protein n=1 Tax=Dipteronia sinensis TaxID=43782 RepID=A0AAE0A623_9ROSI|nr:hypothetical protein Dsin_018696 [Dipteronia sinensis]
MEVMMVALATMEVAICMRRWRSASGGGDQPPPTVGADLEAKERQIASVSCFSSQFVYLWLPCLLRPPPPADLHLCLQFVSHWLPCLLRLPPPADLHLRLQFVSLWLPSLLRPPPPADLHLRLQIATSVVANAIISTSIPSQKRLGESSHHKPSGPPPNSRSAASLSPYASAAPSKDIFEVKTPSMPQLPQHKELFLSLSPYHAKLVGESYLGRKRPIYECTEVQKCRKSKDVNKETSKDLVTCRSGVHIYSYDLVKAQAEFEVELMPYKETGLVCYDSDAIEIDDEDDSDKDLVEKEEETNCADLGGGWGRIIFPPV